MMLTRKSKKYVAVMLGGTPYHLDVVLDLCADHHPFYIIHGPNTFVVLFSSKKSLKSVRSLFVRLLVKDLTMLFVFEAGDITNYKDGENFILPELIAPLLKVDIKDRYDNQMHGLRMLLDSYDVVNKKNAKNNREEPQDIDEEELSDQEKLGLLLDKMKISGYNSLTPEELDFLRKYKNDNLNKSE